MGVAAPHVNTAEQCADAHRGTFSEPAPVSGYCGESFIAGQQMLLSTRQLGVPRGPRPGRRGHPQPSWATRARSGREVVLTQ